MEVVEAGFGVVVVAAVAQGVDEGHGAGGEGELAVGVVGVGGDLGAAGVDQVHDVSLKIGDVVVLGTVVGQGEGEALGVVGKIQGVAGVGLPEELASGVKIGVPDAVYRLGGPVSVEVVGELQGGIGIGGGGEPPAVFPLEGPTNAVVIADGIAAPDGASDIADGGDVGGDVGEQGVGLALVDDGLAVEGGEEIGPVGVAVRIGVDVVVGAVGEAGGADLEEVTGIVVGVEIGEVLGWERSLSELAQGVVLEGGGGIRVFPLAGDAAVGGVGIVRGGSVGEAGVSQGGDLGGGLAAGDGAVGVSLGVPGAGLHRGQAFDGIVGEGEGVPGGGGHGLHAAVCGAVGVGLGEAPVTDLIALLGEAVVGVVEVLGAQEGGIPVQLGAANETAQGVVLIAVFGKSIAGGVDDRAAGGVAVAVVDIDLAGGDAAVLVRII